MSLVLWLRSWYLNRKIRRLGLMKMEFQRKYYKLKIVLEKNSHNPNGDYEKLSR